MPPAVHGHILGRYRVICQSNIHRVAYRLQPSVHETPEQPYRRLSMVTSIALSMALYLSSAMTADLSNAFDVHLTRVPSWWYL